MSAECDALRDELNRISREIAALDGRYILKTDRPKILKDADDAFRNAFAGLFAPLFVGVFNTNMLPYSAEINTAKSNAELAKRTADVADGKAVNAVSKSELAKQKADAVEVGLNGVDTKATNAVNAANGAKNLADVANTKATGAVTDAATSLSKANIVERGLGAVENTLQVVDRKVGEVATKATNALSKAGRAIGLSENALSLAGRGLRLIGRAFVLIDVIFGLFAALTFASQLRELSRRIDGIDRLMNVVFRAIGVVDGKAGQAKRKADDAYARATGAQATADQARSIGQQAASAASLAGQVAYNALGLATSLVFLRQTVPRIQTLAEQASAAARTAQATATAALTRTLRPGQRGLPGVIGLPGRQGVPGRPGPPGTPGRAGERGRAGLPGFPGLAGARGRQGQRGPAAVPGRDGQRGLPGLRGLRGPAGAPAPENPMNDALLRKIDATTTANLATSRGNQGFLGAIATQATAAQAFAVKAWENTRLQKLINLLTLVSVLHNAAMLSRSVGETIGELASNMLATVGIKDETGNQLDINQLVGTSTRNFVQTIVGVEVYTDVSTAWKKASRIVSSAALIVSTVRGLHDTSKDVMEWTAENTGKIGNALKRWGVVGERAYPWMSERVKAQDAYRLKFQRVTDGLESLEDTASSLSTVSSNVREIQEEYTELKTQKNAFTALLTTAPPESVATAAPENAPIAGSEADAKTASASPPVVLANAQKGVVE
jgi:hypothetical protein